VHRGMVTNPAVAATQGYTYADALRALDK
jgi:hypothetical protein